MRANRTFVLGDIHGGYKGLKQCFERSGFDYQKDTLIALGDVCDGWPEVSQCIEELLKIKNLVYIYGNHDYWALIWMKTGQAPDNWVKQGGRNTMNSYKEVPDSHIEFLDSALSFYVLGNRLFVHGGFKPDVPIEEQGVDTLIWDRTLVSMAFEEGQGKNGKLTEYDEVYLGHTPTLRIGTNLPSQFQEIWMMDTGGGWPSGKITIMDIDTKEFYQSDIMETLYPDQSPRD